MRRRPTPTLKDIRRSIGLSQEATADRVGVGTRTWRRWENGENPVPVRRLATVARVLGVTYDRLMLAVGEMEIVDAPEVGSWPPKRGR